jgi:hypothetical protein
MWFLLFIRNLPVIAIAEVKELVPPRLRSHRMPEGTDIAGHHLDFATETPGDLD